MKELFRHFALLGLASICILAPGVVRGQTNWRDDASFSRAVERPLSLNLDNAPLRERLVGLAKSQRIAVFLDRRVDPDQLITISANGITFERLIWEIAEKLGLGVCRLNNLFYIGPKSTTDRLPQLVALGNSELKKLRGSRFANARAPIRWNRLSTPNDVLDQVSTQLGIKWRQPDKLPHDLWPAGDLPDLKPAMQLAIVLAGFDKWFVPSKDEAWKLVDYDELNQSIDWTATPIRVTPSAERLAELVNSDSKFQATIKKSGRAVLISGAPESVAEVRRFVVFGNASRATAGNATAGNPSPLENRRYDLINTKASRGAILTTLCQQANLEFRYAPDTLEFMKANITVNLQQATIEELIREVLKETGLKFQIADGKLLVAK